MYKKNYLKHVIFKLEFGPIPSFSQKESLNNLYDKYLKEIFNVHEIIMNTDISINVKDNVQTVNQTTRYQLICKHSSDDENPSFILDQNNVIIDMLENYQNLEHFIQIIEKCMLCFNKNELFINRLGLRYINEITIPSQENSFLYNTDYICEDLTTKELVFLKDGFEQDIIRSLSQTEFNFTEYKARFVTGYFNKAYPARINENEYIIDIDCYTYTVEPNEILDLVKRMNKDTIEKLFEKSIKNNLRTLMGGNNE